jgi:hypothetical protein
MSDKIPIEKDTSLPATIFHHFFGCRPGTVKEYAELLDGLKAKGIFLMDILDEPLRIRGNNGIVRESLEYLVSCIPSLRERIAARGITVDDEDIVFLLARLHYQKHLKQEFPQARFSRWKDYRMSTEAVQFPRRPRTAA